MVCFSIIKNHRMEDLTILVKIEGKKGEKWLAVSSRQVAEDFEKEHFNVLRDIENLIKKTTSDQQNSKLRTAQMFYKTSYKIDGNLRNYPEYLMDRDGFSLLVMGFTGSEALKWKLKYIEAFNTMEETLKRIYEERKQWEIERAKGIVVRNILTDTIKNMLPESPNKKFAYPNYTNLVYKVLFGKSANDLRQEFKTQKCESVRDYFTADELAEVENLERLSAGLINLGWGYTEIKNFLETNVNRKMIA